MASPPSQATARVTAPASVTRDPDEPERADPTMGQADDRERDDDRGDRDEEPAQVQQRQRVARGLEDLGACQDDRAVGDGDPDEARRQSSVDRRRPADR